MNLTQVVLKNIELSIFYKDFTRSRENDDFNQGEEGSKCGYISRTTRSIELTFSLDIYISEFYLP